MHAHRCVEWVKTSTCPNRCFTRLSHHSSNTRTQETKENAGELAAGNVMKETLLNCCKVEPMLHNLPAFDFQNQAYDEMHSLEGKLYLCTTILCSCLYVL